ncbi:MAG: hypothetical protein IKI28_08075 [Bacteroidales bacterium]|nr:hypothetical protein [Bacteroidales bacterium]
MSKRTPVTIDKLVAAWNGYAENIKQSSPSISSLMQSITPTLVDGEAIGVVVKSAVQLEQLQGMTHPLLDHLKSELQNTSITINFDIDTTQSENTKHIYTKDDQLKDMIRRNPALGKLLSQLNLQIE